MNNFNNNYPLQRNQFNPYYGSTTSTGVGTSTNNIVWVQGIVRDHLKENYKESNHMISNDMKIDPLSLK